MGINCIYIVQFPNTNVSRERYDKRYDNRTAHCNGHFSLAGATGLRKHVYGNGFTVMERISGTLLISMNHMIGCLCKSGHQKLVISHFKCNENCF